jgi:hypothetical protein
MDEVSHSAAHFLNMPIARTEKHRHGSGTCGCHIGLAIARPLVLLCLSLWPCNPAAQPAQTPCIHTPTRPPITRHKPLLILPSNPSRTIPLTPCPGTMQSQNTLVAQHRLSSTDIVHIQALWNLFRCSSYRRVSHLSSSQQNCDLHVQLFGAHVLTSHDVFCELRECFAHLIDLAWNAATRSPLV